MEIFEKTGFPNENNPYIFNGDFVDRGKDGCEIMLILLLFKICYPAHVFLNRGNHEAGNVTEIYGFKTECIERKYDKEVYDAFIELFEWLPPECSIVPVSYFTYNKTVL